MRLAAAVLATLAVALTGCGGPAGDLIAISTTGGGTPHARYVVTGDGLGSCNGAKEKTLASQTVLDAREVERELTDYAKKRSSFSNGPAGARRYVASTKDGLVTWVEGARGAPPVIGKAILLTQNLKRELCP
jgi:hypothetical protein